MKQLKFRAWDDGKMIYSDSFNSDQHSHYACLSKFFESIRKDSIMMQSTGLTDKNGVNIYEGDQFKIIMSVNGNDRIMRGSSYGTEKEVECIFRVIWNPSDASFRLVTDTKNTYKTTFFRGTGRTKSERDANSYREITGDIKCPISRVMEFEVIGNIYQSNNDEQSTNIHSMP
jgi:uncharacterized phage protein (TIGR01671 family)